jgi:signal transduction histidine kinase
MSTDLEIIYNLRETFNFAVIRANSHGFLYMNAEAMEMFGFSSMEEIASYPRRTLFADRDLYHHLVTKQKAYGRLINERVLFNRKNRSNFWGCLTSRLYEVDGELYYDDIIWDVSEEVANEHKLSEKSHLLEKVANELDRFIYSASHDLRAPISSMKGLIYLFRMNMQVFSCGQLLDMMEESLNKLEVFINKLVEFSKNSNQPVIIEPICLAKVIRSILEGMKPHPNSAKTNVEWQAPADSLLYSDYSKIHTALFHVIKNAFDFVDPTKGSGLLSIKADINRERACVEIIDNGIGIEKHLMSTIFQMFFRASSLSKGSGLGLYLAREALVRLGGSIDISSEPNLGTVVTIQIPNEITQAYGGEELKMA